MELKNFDEMLALVPKGKALRAAVVGSDSENVLKAVFQAQDEGFAQPILVGDRARTTALLDKLGFAPTRIFRGHAGNKDKGNK